MMRNSINVFENEESKLLTFTKKWREKGGKFNHGWYKFFYMVSSAD